VQGCVAKCVWARNRAGPNKPLRDRTAELVGSGKDLSARGARGMPVFSFGNKHAKSVMMRLPSPQEPKVHGWKEIPKKPGAPLGLRLLLARAQTAIFCMYWARASLSPARAHRRIGFPTTLPYLRALKARFSALCTRKYTDRSSTLVQGLDTWKRRHYFGVWGLRQTKPLTAAPCRTSVSSACGPPFRAFSSSGD
jgi:hypothetical protein